MNFDTIIIGGGISGLTAGIALAKQGLKCALISNGANSQHFSSGSIDVMSRQTDGTAVHQPFEYLNDFLQSRPEHPYAKVGIETVRASLSFFAEEIAAEGIHFYCSGEKNHMRITPIGMTRPAYFSQQSVFHEGIANSLKNFKKAALLNFEGYRDFYPALAIPNLKRNPLFKHIEISTGSIKLIVEQDTERNPYEFRSIDIARFFEKGGNILRVADAIKNAAPDAEVVGLPAFIGIWDYQKTHKRLEELTGKIIFEIPTPPPSLPGMRLDEALKSRFRDLGGMYIAGDSVQSGVIENGQISHVLTATNDTVKLHAKAYILATGSFLSKGLVSEFNVIREPVFNLRVKADQDRSKWYAPEFLSHEGHPFTQYGVETDCELHPFDQDKNTIKNMFCAGAVLSGYDPIREASGGGVAISTGYFAAQKILSMVKEQL